MRAPLSPLTRAACAVALLAAPAASAHAQFGKLVKRAASLGGGAVAQAAGAAGQVASGLGAGGAGAGNLRAVRVPLPGAGGAAGGEADPRRERYEACMAEALENPGPAAATNEAFAREYGALGQRMAAVGQQVMTTPPDSPRYAALQDSATMLGEAMARLQYPNVAARCGPPVWPAAQGAPGAAALAAAPAPAGGPAATRGTPGKGAPGAGSAVKALGQVGVQVALATATGGTAPLLLNAGLSAGRSVLAARRAAHAAKTAHATGAAATNAVATAAPATAAPATAAPATGATGPAAAPR